MQITVDTQSSIRIAAEDKVIRFDPFRMQDAPHDTDLILITHAHFDHFSPEDIQKAAKAGTVIVMPKSMRREAAGLPEECVFLRPGEETTVCGFRAEAVPAYNTNKPMHPRRNNWLGYVLTAEGQRVYVTGDTDDIPEGRAVRCELLFLPIGGTYTMDAREAAAFTNAVRPVSVIPTHYGSIVGSPEDEDVFRSAVLPEIEVIGMLF